MLRVVGISKVFRSGEADLVLFENLSFTVARGEMVAIVGESGTGKSTLLHILGALERASRGDVYCANSHLNLLAEDGAADFRNSEVGFVWQFHYLLPEFSALENVAMPLLMRGQSWKSVEPSAQRWLGEVGLQNEPTTAPVSSPAASNSGLPWRALSLLNQKSCSRTNRPAISMAAQPKSSST